MEEPLTPLALRQWRAEWQGRVRVALNDANRGRKEWETATNEGAAAATEWANAALHEASLHSLQLGSLEPLSKELLPRAALALRQRTSESRKLLISAVEASSAAAALLEAAASSLEAGVASALPVPVFASLGLPAIAGCFRRAAEPHRKETERVRKKVVAAADAAVEEWRRRRGKGGGGEEGRMKKGSPSSSESLNLLRSQLTVVISAWKLQALLGPGVVFIAPAAATGGGGRASGAVGSPGAGVAAELAGVKAEMEGF